MLEQVHHCLLLGRDHDHYGQTSTVAIASHAAASISVGADSQSPSMRFKAHDDVPNEDALCVVEVGNMMVMAVADAHYGPEASHGLIEQLYAELKASMPVTAIEVDQLIARLATGPECETESESTLLVAQLDRRTGQGYAVSFGDSTLAIVTEGGQYESITAKNNVYVAPAEAGLLSDGLATMFSLARGDTMLMFTDGVDECHYRHPDTSVQPAHIVDLVVQADRNPARVSASLAELALRGVDGHPGGQDNIALIVVRA